MSDLHRLDAVALVDLLVSGQVSAAEVLEAHLERIAAINGELNAVVTLAEEQARSAAAAADAAHAAGTTLGPLHGLPVGHKDLANTKGIRTTLGSPIFADQVPAADDVVVARQRAAGAVSVGKTNTPEFGAGSQTFNSVFGTTVNPYDTSRTCGGSSGGAAVALAARMLPLCDGSDLGGSLRNPAAFTNVVGLRPSVGRVPSASSADLWGPLATEGPMARTVADVALFLAVLAGPHADNPSSLPADERLVNLAAAAASGRAERAARELLDVDLTGKRVAWSPTAGGLPVDPAITNALYAVGDLLAELGCEVVEAWPDLSDAGWVFAARRAWLFSLGYGPLLERHRDQMKDTVIWNITRGMEMTVAEFADAGRAHAALYGRMSAFMRDYDFLAAPVTQVPPFTHDIEYPTQVAGTQMSTYIEWMRSCSDITLTTQPAISVPGGFTDDALPVGLQLIGRRNADVEVCQLAYAFERATRHGELAPTEPLRSG